MRAAVIRKARFNAAHRLLNKGWTAKRNLEVFGKCFNPNYHGHNYTIEVKVIGDIDPNTGFVVNLGYLKKIINQEIIEKFDHRNLNMDVDEFADMNPTAENIAVVCYNLLRSKLDHNLDLFVRLYETERNIVEYPVS